MDPIEEARQQRLIAEQLVTQVYLDLLANMVIAASQHFGSSQKAKELLVTTQNNETLWRIAEQACKAKPNSYPAS